ncbi:MAG: hypothetical protein AAB839_03135 [Patescibacteria group bacterium]
MFGPEYAARVLDQEQAFLDAGDPEGVAEWTAWVVGLSPAELRKKFPAAIQDAEPFREIHPSREGIESRKPRLR